MTPTAFPAPLGQTHAESAAKRIYSDLRESIVDMSALPGARIVEKDIAADYGISRTPVREAVLKLADEGLIEIFPRLGTFVGRIPLDSLEEAMLVRQALEQVTVKAAAQKVDANGIARLRAILQQERQAAEAANVKAFHHIENEFHATIATLAGHSGIWRIIEQAKTQVDRYRWLLLANNGRMQIELSEHEKIVEALVNRDEQGAIQAMQAHLAQVLPNLNVAWHQQPEYFVSRLSFSR